MTAIEAQLTGKCKDVLVHAATGFGETAIAAGPHVHEKSKGRFTLMVSPLISLQEDQVCTVHLQRFRIEGCIGRLFQERVYARGWWLHTTDHGGMSCLAVLCCSKEHRQDINGGN